MRLRNLATLACAAAAVLALPSLAHASTCPNAELTPAPTNLARVRSAMLCLHNQERAAQHLRPLRENSRLDRAASRHSADMVGNRYFSHTAPDGTTFVRRILGAGYARPDAGWDLGENLAWGTGGMSTPDAIMDAWMNSPGHRANVLHRGYRDIGIGVALGVPTDPAAGVTVSVEFGAV
jgi:uncharacterized protein YkwD